MANNRHLVASHRQVPLLPAYLRPSITPTLQHSACNGYKHIHAFTDPFSGMFAYASTHVRAQISGCRTNGNSQAKGRMKLSTPHIQHAHQWGRQWKITGDFESAEALLLHCPSPAMTAGFCLAPLLAPSFQQLQKCFLPPMQLQRASFIVIHSCVFAREKIS